VKNGQDESINSLPTRESLSGFGFHLLRVGGARFVIRGLDGALLRHGSVVNPRGPLRNSREKTAESNNGQLLAKGGKHIRPQDRDFPMNTETGFSKKMRRGAEKRLRLTFERVRADSRRSRGPYGPLGNSERRRRAGIVCTRQRQQPLRFLIDPGELSSGFGTEENFVPSV
jgi:hypothetical protein